MIILIAAEQEMGAMTIVNNMAPKMLLQEIYQPIKINREVNNMSIIKDKIRIKIIVSRQIKGKFFIHYQISFKEN